MSVNKVILMGRLGQDPELKYTPSGAAVCRFSVATSDAWTDKQGQKQERTEWHRIVVWGKLGELCNQYLAKGRQAYLEGSLQTNSWEDKQGQKRYTTEITARTVQFIGGRADASSSQSTNYQSSSKEMGDMNQQAPSDNQTMNQDYNVTTDSSFTADDIPF